MSLSPNLKTTFVYLLSLTLLSLFVFAVLQGWYATQNVDHYIQVEAELTQEISELEVYMANLEHALDLQQKELKIRDQLIEEKNIELDFMNQELGKWKARYFHQKTKPQPSTEPVILSLMQ